MSKETKCDCCGKTHKDGDKPFGHGIITYIGGSTLIKGEILSWDTTQKEFELCSTCSSNMAAMLKHKID